MAATASALTTADTYPLADTYTVTLKVTDDDGAFDEVSHDVTVTAPVGEIEVALDEFDVPRHQQLGNGREQEAPGPLEERPRTSASTDRPAESRLAIGQTRTGTLGAVSERDVESVVDFSLEQAQTGGGVYVSSVLRKVGTSEYRLRAAGSNRRSPPSSSCGWRTARQP